MVSGPPTSRGVILLVLQFKTKEDLVKLKYTPPPPKKRVQVAVYQWKIDSAGGTKAEKSMLGIKTSFYAKSEEVAKTTLPWSVLL